MIAADLSNYDEDGACTCSLHSQFILLWPSVSSAGNIQSMPDSVLD